MEAGLEHLSRSTTRSSDAMLVVAEPYYKSLETAARISEMASQLGIPRTYVIANKIRTERERAAIEQFATREGLTILATVPYDEAIAEASLLPAAPIDHAPTSPGVAAVSALADTLLGMPNGGSPDENRAGR